MSPSARETRAIPSPIPGLYADPSLAIVAGRYWLFPTTDGSDRWSASSFEAFSSTDLVDWHRHGEVLRLQDDVAWATGNAWAPAFAARNGEYFLYFTADGGTIGVARASDPAGPYRDLGRPLISPGEFSGVAIDPSVFQDDDGQWFLLWGNGVAHAVPLGDDMMSFDPAEVVEWTPTGFREAITIHRCGELYYASWSENDTRDPDYRVRYATSTSWRGPWTDRGILIEPDRELGYLGTGHHAVMRIDGADEWVVAYHRFALEEGNGYRRELIFEPLTHEADGRLVATRRPEGFARPLEARPSFASPPSNTLEIFGRRPDDHGDPSASTGAIYVNLARPDGMLPLRSGGGIIYARSEALPDGRQSRRTLRDPQSISVGGELVVAAVPLGGNGGELSGKDRLLIANGRAVDAMSDLEAVQLDTADGIHGLMLGTDGEGAVIASWRSSTGETISRRLTHGDGWSAEPHLGPVAIAQAVHLDDAKAERLRARLGVVQSLAVHLDVPAAPTVAAVQASGARIEYDDGSSRRITIEWWADDLAQLSRPGRHRVRGRVPVLDFPFPLVPDRADPMLFFYHGRWHLLGTDEVDRGSDHGLLIRSAERPEDLPDAPDVKILGLGIAGIEGCFWAPEVHEIGGALRLLFAPSIGTREWSGVQCHIMTLRDGGDPAAASDWTVPVPVLTRDGLPLQLSADQRGISLDMTFVQAGGRAYYVWSQRVIVGEFVGDAELWIAEVNEIDPTRLKGDPVLLHTGRWSWELTGTNVVEGPFALVRDEVVHLAYAAAAVGPDYTTGFLRASVHDDLLDPASWKAQPYPALDSHSVPGQWGPGHVSFSTYAGETLVAFHALPSRGDVRRATGLRRVHWRADGTPDLAVTPDRDVAPHLRDVVLEVDVPKAFS